VAERPTVSIRIGGSTYRVHSSASPEEVQRLADLVDEKLRALNTGNQPASPQSFLLVALSFAHDLDEEKLRRQAAEGEVRELLRRLGQVGSDAPPPPPPRPPMTRALALWLLLGAAACAAPHPYRPRPLGEPSPTASTSAEPQWLRSR